MYLVVIMNKTYQLPCVTLDSYYFQQKGKNKNLIKENSNKQNVDILKNEISSVKKHVWRNAVKFTNPYESVCKNYNMKISRAYFKLIEILVDFVLWFFQEPFYQKLDVMLHKIL